MKSEFINDKTHSKIGKEDKLDKVIGPLKTLMKVLYLTICWMFSFETSDYISMSTTPVLSVWKVRKRKKWYTTGKKETKQDYSYIIVWLIYRKF